MSNEEKRIDLALIELLGFGRRWREAESKQDAEVLAGIEAKALAQMWETPPEMVRGIEVLMGRRFDVDICAEPRSSKAPLHFGPGSKLEVYDSFSDPWPTMHRETLHWGNPDYNGKRKNRWVDLVLRYGYQTVLNVPLSTDMGYAAKINADSRCHLTFITGRCEYLPPKGITASKPRGPTVLIPMNFHSNPLPPSVHIDELMELGADALAKDRGER